MKRDLFTMALDLGNELIIDNFAHEREMGQVAA